MRTCSKCKVEQDDEQFRPRVGRPAGQRVSWCKGCHYESRRVWAAKNPDKISAYTRSARRRDPAYFIWHSAKLRAVASGVEFALDRRDVVIPERCPILGTLFTVGDRRTAPSLDRIDPTRGYVRGNVHVISWRANRLKSDALPWELRAIADYMARLMRAEAA